MKRVLFLSCTIFILLGSFFSNAQTARKQGATKYGTSKIEVYYFHFTQRCATCLAVEANSKSALAALYPEKVKTGEYTFKEINLEDAKSKSLAQKLNVGGQTLLVVSGSKKVDLTSKAFMYAQDRNRIKEEIKKAIQKVTIR
jgi:hypothetical protein